MKNNATIFILGLLTMAVVFLACVYILPGGKAEVAKSEDCEKELKVQYAMPKVVPTAWLPSH